MAQKFSRPRLTADLLLLTTALFWGSAFVPCKIAAASLDPFLFNGLRNLAQRHAPPTDAAVIMSLEAVFAALFGGWLLGERLTPLQLVGCGLMLSGMILAQRGVMRPASPRPSSPPAYSESPGQRTPE